MTRLTQMLAPASTPASRHIQPNNFIQPGLLRTMSSQLPPQPNNLIQPGLLNQMPRRTAPFLPTRDSSP